MTTSRRRRGYIERLPSGSFRAVAYAGVDPLSGTRRNITETVGTHDEAERALTRLLHQVDENKHPKSAITVSEAVEQWLEVADLEETTRDRYEDLVRLYVTPRLGAMQVARIDVELLERLYARLEKCREMCGGRPSKSHTCRPLSSSTTRKIHYFIRGALGLAVRWNYLGVNVAELAEAPSPAKTKPDPPSATEAVAILEEAWRDPEWGLLIWLTMVTGCRRGELCSLRWSHLDVARSKLWVERAVSQPRSGIKEKETKTGTDRRPTLDPLTMELLAEHRERVAKQLAGLGIDADESTFIFSTAPDYSIPRVPRSVTQRYRLMARRLKLRSTRLHALRHYSATELLAAGVDLRTVSGRLGHSNGATTLKAYAAWVEAADHGAAEKMATIMPKARPTPKPRPRGPYESIAADLRGDIESGRLKPGDQLPTIVQLAAQYTVAAGTAHRAVAALSTEGLIQVTRGRRAIVLPTRDDH
jgi:integrase